MRPLRQITKVYVNGIIYMLINDKKYKITQFTEIWLGTLFFSGNSY